MAVNKQRVWPFYNRIMAMQKDSVPEGATQDTTELRPGDYVFFRGTGDGIDWVGPVAYMTPAAFYVSVNLDKGDIAMPITWDGYLGHIRSAAK